MIAATPSEIKRFAPTSYAGDVLEALRGDGIAIIEGATSASTIDKVLSEVGTVSSGQVHGLAGKSSTFTSELLMHPLYVELTKRLLTDTSVIYYEKERTVSTAHPQVSLTVAHAAQPGSLRVTDFGIAYAANDITAESGAIRVVVGSNRWNDTRDPTDEDESLVQLKKGDALLVLGSVYYGVKPNMTSNPSILLSAFTTPGWCRQEENQYLAVPFKVSQKYNDEVQKFLGYYVSRPYGGAVEHMEPLDFLKANGDWSKYVPVDLV